MRQRLFIFLGLAIVACAQDEDPAAQSADDFVAATAAEHDGDEPVATPITDIPPRVEVIDEELVYGATEDHNLTGYLVLPADAVDVPGVIMIHEWWGLNDNIKAMARRLAGEGYAVLAIDLYAGETATTTARAENLMATAMSNREATLDNIRQAHAYLDQFALAPRIATLGWCLGGGWSLEAALALGEDVDAAVMFYGRVINDDDLLAPLESPLLGLFAEADESIPVSDVQQFRSRLRALGKDAQVLIYSDVNHAFANPSGTAYNQTAAEEAWAETLTFLDERLH
jgi:carboxymethylenebutenolidase